MIPAGSPRVLIYSDAPLKHRVLVFGEADSLPAGEDNPAASAVRNLLQDHELSYDVTISNAQTGRNEVQEVRKEGPTVLITTSTKSLGDQLMTRLFILEIPYDQEQLKAALRTQALLEISGGSKANNDVLVAYQSYLQALAPWDVVVPFVKVLFEKIACSTDVPRVLRDVARLISLVKSVTVFRHSHRRINVEGRLVATVEDYRTIYDLVGDMYESSLTGISEKVRQIVGAVKHLVTEDSEKSITVTAVAKALNISGMAAGRGVNRSLKFGWLVNEEARRYHPKRLAVGEPMPNSSGLPSPEEIMVAYNAITPSTDGDATPLSPGDGKGQVPVQEIQPLQGNVQNGPNIQDGGPDTRSHRESPQQKRGVPEPSEPCPACGSGWWQRPDDGWACKTCHPDSNSKVAVGGKPTSPDVTEV